MTITARGRSRSLLFALVLVFAPQLFGAEAWPPYAQNAKSDAPRETVFQFDQTKQLGVIIEFREAPLLESRRTKDVRLASAGLDALTAQLGKDLARIEGEVPGRIAAQASDTGAIRHAYRMTFAGASATVSRASLAAIRALPYVRAVHEDRKVEIHLARSVPHIGVPEIRARYGRRGKGIVVAIIDTGINYKHWALGEGFGAGFKVIGGYDVINGDADPMDDHGHGTHVAGIVAANHQSLTGVAPEATLLAYKVLDAEGGGSQSTVLAGVERAIDPNGDGDPSDRADVVNMSLGGPVTPNDPVIAAVERGVAAGAVFSLSAGNSGIIAGLGSPALAPSAITVAASDLQDKVAGFSTGGPVGGTWNLKPEISAPGVGIVSSVLENGTRAASGTSMAAPHVSGVAALLLEQHPDWTPQDVKTAIVSTAKPVTGRELQGNVTAGSFIAYSGSGRLDALAAMEATILPSQPAATFGMVAAKGQPWTATSTVTLTNRGTSSDTLTLQPPQVPAGAKLTVVPETFTLAPGASVELQLTLEVAAEAKANDSEVLIAGILAWTGTKTSLRLPWTILKADVLQVTYGGDEEFVIFLSNGARPAGMWPEGPRTYAALIPRHLSSDILILTPQTETREARLLIRERQPVDGFTPVTVSPDEAPYLVHFDAQDERGIPLKDLSSAGPGRLSHQFQLPSFNYVRINRDDGVRKVRVSTLKETRVISYETASSGTDRWFVAYDHLKNVKKDLMLTVRPSDWASQKIRHFCTTGDCTAFVGVGTGPPQGYVYHPMPRNEREWTLHLTRGIDDDRYDFRAYFFVREGDFTWGDESVNPWTLMSNSLRNVNGRFSTSPFGRVSGAEYFPPDRDTPLVIGDGPVIPRTAVGAWFVQVDPYGSSGEYLGDKNVRDMNVKIERLDGPVTIYPNDKSSYSMRPTPGTYRLTVTDGYKVAGRSGRMTQTSHYDTHATPDGPPTLSSLRVESGRGVSTWTVPAGSPSRIAFAARQSVMTTNASWDVQHSRLDAGATQVWWRPHGATEWLPLTVTNTGEDYAYKGEFPGSPGTLYTASLGPATASEGAVDLKFSLKNKVGGTTELVYEPAFIVGPAGTRRRTMR
ncbi:MAG TPA: S8 family serine peptidase [Thermoanaerobaculia bacterium]